MLLLLILRANEPLAPNVAAVSICSKPSSTLAAASGYWALSSWAINVAEHAAEDHFPCKYPVTNPELSLDVAAVNLTAQLAPHAREGCHYVRQQVLLHTKAQGRVSATPYLKGQGLLF
jgi:hypothetical protein